MAYTLTMEERETHIRWDAAEKVAHIFTADPVSARKLDKMVDKCPEAYKLVRVDEYGGRYYEAPANLINFRAPMSKEFKDKRRQIAIESNSASHLRRQN